MSYLKQTTKMGTWKARKIVKGDGDKIKWNKAS